MNYRTARQVLGTHSASTYTDIKQAFRRKAKELHPDHNPSPTAAARFATLTQAHKFLMEYRSPFQSRRYSDKSTRARGIHKRHRCFALVLRQTAALILILCASALAQTEPYLNVAWDLIPATEGVAVNYRVQTTVGSLPFITAAECVLPPCLVTGIEASTTYKIRVAGIEANGTEGDYSDPISFKFSSIQPISPTSLSVSSATSSQPGKITKQLSWSATTKFRTGALFPAGSVVEYRVYQAAGNGLTLVVFNSLANSMTVDLDKNRSYQFWVTCIVDGVESFTSPAVRITTQT